MITAYQNGNLTLAKIYNSEMLRYLKKTGAIHTNDVSPLSVPNPCNLPFFGKNLATSTPSSQRTDVIYEQPPAFSLEALTKSY